MAPKATRHKFYKKFLKTIQAAKGYPQQSKQLIRLAPVPVLKLLSNAALIASNGNIRLTPAQKKLFRRKTKLFNVLGDRSIDFAKKRQYIIQRGGAAFIPILLSTILPLVGDLLFRAISNSSSSNK